MLVTPAPIVAYIVCFTYLDSSTIKSQLPELVHSFTNAQWRCSDGNAQVRANYQSNIRANGWPWSLTICLLLAGSVYNAYYLYKLVHKDDELGELITHATFQHEIALRLLQNPELFGRQKASSISISSTVSTKRFILTSAHRLIRRVKRGYCSACKTTKERPAKREILGEIDNYGNKRKRNGSESWYGCAGCVGSYCCRKGDCFEAIHS